jgi:hypothetical protein
MFTYRVAFGGQQAASSENRDEWRAWADGAGLLDNWHDRLVGQRGILYWKREEGQPGSEGRGRAWVIEADGSERLINDGDPISRTEAERLAQVGEYILDAEA